MKWTCIHNKRVLSKYADAELSDVKAKDALEKHLKDCPDCAEELTFLMATKQLFAAKEKLACSDDFLTRLQDRLKPEPEIITLRWVEDVGSWSRRFIPVPVAVMLLACAVLFSRVYKAAPKSEVTLQSWISSDLASVDVDLTSSRALDTMFFQNER